MKCLAYIVLACALTQTGAFGADQATPTGNATASAEDAGLRAQVLLQRAVAHYQDIKESALADFTGKGEFVDGELYVYVVSEGERSNLNHAGYNTSGSSTLFFRFGRTHITPG